MKQVPWPQVLSQEKGVLQVNEDAVVDEVCSEDSFDEISNSVWDMVYGSQCSVTQLNFCSNIEVYLLFLVLSRISITCHFNKKNNTMQKPQLKREKQHKHLRKVVTVSLQIDIKICA